MMTKEEFIEVLRKSKKNYSEEQIAEKVEEYLNRLNNPRPINSRASRYSEIANLIGVQSLNDVRFYKIMNASAVVVRDPVANKTRVAFSFYNTSDLIHDCREADKVKDGSGKIIWNDNQLPILHQITISKAYNSCLWTARNYHDSKFTVEFNDLRISELAVYEAWVRLCKDKVIPRFYRNFNLDCHVVAVNEIHRREAMMNSRKCHC